MDDESKAIIKELKRNEHILMKRLARSEDENTAVKRQNAKLISENEKMKDEIKQMMFNPDFSGDIPDFLKVMFK